MNPLTGAASADPEVRKTQRLRKVAATSTDPEQRAMAAQALHEMKSSVGLETPATLRAAVAKLGRLELLSKSTNPEIRIGAIGALDEAAKRIRVIMKSLKADGWTPAQIADALSRREPLRR